MKNTIKKVRNLNFKDFKNEVNEKNDSLMAKYLKSLNEDKLNIVIKYMRIGRELSFYYGSVCKISYRDYLEYFSETYKPVTKEEAIEYIYSNRDRLNNYLDTVLKFLI